MIDFIKKGDFNLIECLHVNSLSSYPITTVGCTSVPATRFATHSNSRGPANTFTSGAAENSGTFTCIPFRIFPAVCSSTITDGISGSSDRGCGRASPRKLFQT